MDRLLLVDRQTVGRTYNYAPDHSFAFRYMLTNPCLNWTTYRALNLPLFTNHPTRVLASYHP